MLLHVSLTFGKHIEKVGTKRKVLHKNIVTDPSMEVKPVQQNTSKHCHKTGSDIMP